MTENSRHLYETNIDKLKKAIELDPNNFAAYHSWGLSLYYFSLLENSRELFEESLEKYKKATELNPNYFKVYTDWGDALYCLAKQEDNKELYEECFEKYKKVTEIKPNYADVYYKWGLALYDLAELNNNSKELYEKSFEKFKKGLELKYKKDIDLNPNDSAAYYNWGDELCELAELSKNNNNKDLYYDASYEKYLKATELENKKDIELSKELPIKTSKELVPMTNLSKKLRSGYIVLLRNKTTGIIIHTCGMYYVFFGKHEEYKFISLKEKYSLELRHISNSEYDIMKIVIPNKPVEKFDFALYHPEEANCTVLYERVEKTISMQTIAELLGCKVEEVIITK